MGDRASSGFTIIEVILFLAVTGALIAGMMVATSMTLGTQRYRDATESFKALVQEQYAGITSVQNSRSHSLTCDSQANVISGDVLRGQSDCVLMGKYMIIRGGNVTIYPVLGYGDISSLSTNDITSFRNDFAINIDKANVVQKKLEWNTQISWTTTRTTTSPEDYNTPRTNRSIAILFLRAPSSGQVYTFTSNSVPAQSTIDASVVSPGFIRNMIVSGAVVPGQKGRVICLDSGGLTPIPNTSIYIAPFASGASSVEVRSNDFSASIGAAERC